MIRTADFTNKYYYTRLDQIWEVEQYDTPGGNTVTDRMVQFDYYDDGRFRRVRRYTGLDGGPTTGAVVYTYDRAGRITALDHYLPVNNVLGTPITYDYTYDRADRLTSYAFAAAFQGQDWGHADVRH